MLCAADRQAHAHTNQTKSGSGSALLTCSTSSHSNILSASAWCRLALTASDTTNL